MKRVYLDHASSSPLRPAAFESGESTARPLLEYAINEESVWACTTCGACPGLGMAVAGVRDRRELPAWVDGAGRCRDCRRAVREFGADRVVYATKAFLCGAMARLAHEEGLLLDDVMPPVAHWAADEDVPLPSRTSIPALQRRIGRTV